MNGEARLFTPRTTHGERLRLRLSETDWRKIKRGRPWSACVQDINTGQWYRVRGASCGSPSCFCDAIAVPVGVPA